MKVLMKKALFLLIMAPLVSFGQNATIVNARTGNASAVLDLSNNTSKKAFLPPRVSLTNLTSITNPIAAPAEGLIIYNIGTAQLPGYYIFNNGVWSLMATRENSVINVIYQKATAEVKTLTSAPNFTTVTGFTQFFNKAGSGVTDDGNSKITLQPGKYVVNVSFNISTSEVTTGSIGSTNGNTHAHFYSGRLWNGSQMLGGEIQLNEISNTSGNKKHSPTFVFSFELASSDSFQFQLARRTGGTFTGNVSINNAFINIEKSLP